jgi:hypothetical protein
MHVMHYSQQKCGSCRQACDAVCSGRCMQSSIWTDHLRNHMTNAIVIIKYSYISLNIH